MDKTKIAIEIFDNCATAYQDKFMDLDLYNDTFDLFCASVIKENAEVLDLACGPGNITRYLLENRPDFNVLGTDLSAKMIDLARKNNPGAEFHVLDCRDIGKIGKQFDAVICGFGLPYLSKEEALQLIRDTAGLLRPGGVFYISTMEDDYEKSGFKKPSSGSGPEMYIHYHQADYLTAALEENGFKLINLSRQEFPASAGMPATDLVLLARLNSPDV